MTFGVCGDEDLPDEDWVVRFLTAVGSDPGHCHPGSSPLPCRSCPCSAAGGPPGKRSSRLSELASARFPKLVVSGGHSAGFDAICDDLAEQIGASRAVVAGAGHEVQFTGRPVNEALLALWRTAATHPAGPAQV